MTNQQLCERFFEARKTIILSTIDKQHITETSVTPFVVVNSKLYIYVSELAKHTQNLLWLLEQSQTQISALVMADESATEQLFARERITLQLRVDEVKYQQEDYATVLAKFTKQFGEVISMLSTLPDFHLFALTPIKGGYVRGFGQAFAFDGCPCQNLTAIKR